MIRLCPNCDTERPLTEIFCEGTVDAHNCGWDLSAVSTMQAQAEVLDGSIADDGQLASWRRAGAVTLLERAGGDRVNTR